MRSANKRTERLHEDRCRIATELCAVARDARAGMEDRTRTPAGSGQPIYTGSKDEKKLQKAAYRAGWRQKKKRAGFLWLAPDGVGQVMVHGTTSDHRSLANQRAAFRRAGLDVRPSVTSGRR